MAGWRLFGDYLSWHYSLALAAGWRIYGNLLWFLYHFWSVPLLVRTLFSPWRRLAENYPQGFNPQGMAETLVVNGLMRLFGVIVRLIFLSVAGLVLFLALAAGWLVLAIWLAAPGLILVSLVIGFYLTFLT